MNRKDITLKLEKHIQDLKEAIEYQKTCKEGIKLSRWKLILFFQKKKMGRLDASIKKLESDVLYFEDIAFLHNN